jgi:HAD superfamily hydrolase (TIGR01484 family)
MKTDLIALDIDGTITDDHHKISPDMIEYLKTRAQNGSVICFITGRFFPFAFGHLKALNFPYYLATQNGAEIFEMPQGRRLASYQISKDIILEIDFQSRDIKEDFIVYADERLDYTTFYREGRFSKELLSHILSLESMAFHPFKKIDCFSNLPLRSFTCLKNIGTYEELKLLNDRLKSLPIEQSLIQDPTSKLYHMNLVTHPSATKGGALKSILKLINHELPTIAAGNDLNDVSLLQSADIGICVGDQAPQELIKHAKLRAQFSGLGLIPSLEEARNRLGL